MDQLQGSPVVAGVAVFDRPFELPPVSKDERKPSFCCGTYDNLASPKLEKYPPDLWLATPGRDLPDSPPIRISVPESISDGTSAFVSTSKSRTSGESAPAGVTWKPLLHQSLYYLAIMHSFRVATEPGTREGLGNPLIRGYFKALGAMHGWSDGDPYFVNYLGHPIEGAVSGYIWLNNDPHYQNVEFGLSRDYWMSRLRAYAFAWAFSEQFEIGPLSEASIGQIQRYCCAYGFVDHVITPNGGAVWLVGGDILDKYVVRYIENHTDNVPVRVFARSLLNPPLSFANVLSGKVPWHRNNRPGVHAYEGDLYLRVADTRPPVEQEIPTFEIAANLPSVIQFGRLYCVGGGGVGAFRLPGSWQWTVEASGCTLGNFEKNWSGDSLTFSTGPQWISHTSSRWSPHFSMRMGGQKVTQEYVERLLNKAPPPAPESPDSDTVSVRYPHTKHYETTGLSLSISGGADLKLNSVLAIRVANFDYMHSWLRPLNGYAFDQGYRFSTGVVLRVGTW